MGNSWEGGGLRGGALPFYQKKRARRRKNDGRGYRFPTRRPDPSPTEQERGCRRVAQQPIASGLRCATCTVPSLSSLPLTTTRLLFRSFASFFWPSVSDRAN